MVVVIAGMTTLVLHSKSEYLPFGTLPFPTEVIETLDVLVVTAMKISVSVPHGGKSASNSLYWPPALGPALPSLINKYLTDTKEITNTIAYFLQIWQSLNHSKTSCNFMESEGLSSSWITDYHSFPSWARPILLIYLLILYIL